MRNGLRRDAVLPWSCRLFALHHGFGNVALLFGREKELSLRVQESARRCPGTEPAYLLVSAPSLWFSQSFSVETFTSAVKKGLLVKVNSDITLTLIITTLKALFYSLSGASSPALRILLQHRNHGSLSRAGSHRGVSRVLRLPPSISLPSPQLYSGCSALRQHCPSKSDFPVPLPLPLALPDAAKYEGRIPMSREADEADLHGAS